MKLIPTIDRRRQRGFIINPYAFGVPPTDPNFSSVTLLLHGEGTDGQTASIMVDSSGSPLATGDWSVQGDLQIDTGYFKRGAASFLFDGTGDYVYVVDGSRSEFTSGDFTIESWIRPILDGNSATNYAIVVKGPGATSYCPFICIVKGDGKLWCLSSLDGSSWGVNLLSAAGVVASATWTHWAYVREGDDFSIYAGQSGTGSRVATTNVSGTLMSAALLASVLGAVDSTGPAMYYNGHIDEFRITKGVARYSGATYTVPTAAFPNS